METACPILMSLAQTPFPLYPLAVAIPAFCAHPPLRAHSVASCLASVVILMKIRTRGFGRELCRLVPRVRE